MDKKWTLHVENFAKIKSADVEIAPLMCFVGENNTGKSYLMSLLWGILTLGKEIFPKTSSDAKSYKQCESWLRENSNQNVILSVDVIDMYLEWFNELLTNNKKSLMKRLFNYDVDIEKIEIREYKIEKEFNIQWEEESIRYSVSKNYIKFPKQREYTREELLKMNAYICWNLLMDGIAAPLYTPLVRGRRTGEPVYLPASRTGFMLTFLQLVGKSIDRHYSQSVEEGSSILTLPYIDFLQLITEFEQSNKKSKYADVIDFIETEMTKGSINVKKEFFPVITYKPSGSNKELPLYVASSVVSEVSPMLLTLKSNINFKAIIIEEPEAHLHPELQQKMAQFIIRLMNSGVLVWITTHSDTILQHINNMIKLKNNKERKILQEQYSYRDTDLLDIADVKMYQFTKTEKQKTILEELTSNKHGFVVPTFNKALQAIVEEVYAFQED
ncbi:MAG: AAA family ATPase [Clostridia bacterium]|nr:AAA family ATPase [Clostridia bacterium]